MAADERVRSRKAKDILVTPLVTPPMNKKLYVLVGRTLLALDVLFIGTVEFWRIHTGTGTSRSLQRGLFGVGIGLVILVWAVRKHRDRTWQPRPSGVIIWLVVGILCALSLLGLILLPTVGATGPRH